MLEIVIITALYLCYHLNEEECVPEPPGLSQEEEGDRVRDRDRPQKGLDGQIVLEEVLQWYPKIMDRQGVDAGAVLALIRVESAGNPWARREGSPYWGLLQISNAYAADAYDYADLAWRPARDLHGKGERSLDVFYWYMRRYAFLHGWDPRKVAILHKAGPGALRRILDRGEPLGAAACRDATPGLCEYLSRFDLFYARYRQYLEQRSVSYLWRHNNSFMESI